MATSISYLEVWRVWLSGYQVNPRLELWGTSMIWWGRLGKFMLFCGGATVIFDLAGEEKLRKLGQLLANPWIAVPLLVVWNYLLWSFGLRVASEMDQTGARPLLGILVIAALSGGAAGTVAVPLLVAYSLDTERPARVLRHIAVGMLLVGFHFDLLAS